ncbi:MAG: chemotaxis protein CheD [Bacillota bacterium]|nr:chemotaxis protein CheD [Bacillota bacterium]
MEKVIGIGEWAVSNNINDSIKTYALGSCVAVTVYCFDKRVLGMAHIALPYSGIKVTEAKPEAYFADKALPLLIDKVCQLSLEPSPKLIIKLFGGAQSNNRLDVFNVGQRNIAAIKNILEQQGFPYDSLNTGGNVSRTVSAYVADGNCEVHKYPLSTSG